jgi:hypothetical protein
MSELRNVFNAQQKLPEDRNGSLNMHQMQRTQFRTRAIHAIGREQEAHDRAMLACGTPVGVLDPATGSQIEALKNQVAAIDERLNRIAKALQE